MKHIFRRLSYVLTQVLFSIITPPLLFPKIAKLRFTRFAIAFCFGRLYGNRYDDIIATLEDSYGAPMSKAMEYAKELVKSDISVILDCGTGTGFVSQQAAAAYPSSTILACDVLLNMLRLARENCKGVPAQVLHVQADTFNLPLADGSVDLVLVQNTIPSFHEFYRVLRPGGLVLYVDTSAGWIAGLAARLVKRHQLFESVKGGRVEMGFYVVAQKSTRDYASEAPDIPVSPYSLLRCPIDKSILKSVETNLICAQGHWFSIMDGFPILMPHNKK